MLLADRGQHRAPSISELLIAEKAGLTVLAVDYVYRVDRTVQRATLRTRSNSSVVTEP